MKVKNRRKAKRIKSYIFNCCCCKDEFKSQGRFSNSNQKYKDYCSKCRKICYMCRIRHGNRGNTCSKYCADRYKKLIWKWKSTKTKNTKQDLDKILTEFKLYKVNHKILISVFEHNYIDIQERCIKINKMMMSIQNHTSLGSLKNKLIFKEKNLITIDKNNFTLYSNNNLLNNIEDYQISNILRTIIQ